MFHKLVVWRWIEIFCHNGRNYTVLKMVKVPLIVYGFWVWMLHVWESTSYAWLPLFFLFVTVFIWLKCRWTRAHLPMFVGNGFAYYLFKFSFREFCARLIECERAALYCWCYFHGTFCLYDQQQLWDAHIS